MSEYTPNLNLFKYNPSTDGKEVFSINQALNYNWDILDNLGSGRNIGEIVASTIPLTDAGLHLLDGSLIQGDGIYSDFVDYIANLYTDNPDANYFAQPQTIRTFNYEKAGTASTNIVENNGVLSGFTTTTAYVKAPAQTPTSSMELVIRVKQNTLTVSQSPIEASTNAHGIVLRVANASTGQISCWMGAGSWFINGVNTGLSLTAGTWTYIKITWDGSTYNFYQSLDGENWTTGTPQTNKTTAPDLSGGICLGGTSWESYPWANGQIDLNGCYLKCNNTMIWQGYTDTYYTAEQMWEQSITTYGVCGRFVYDGTNSTVRLPKITGILEGTIDVNALGALVEAGLPNITGLTGASSLQNRFPVSGAFQYRHDLGSKSYGDHGGSLGDCVYMDASLSNSIYGNSTTVQPQTIKAFYYIVVATSTKTQIQVDIDEIATDLNGKADTDLSNVPNSKSILTESYVNDTSWYRVYSDGWCEQGGRYTIATTGRGTITFLKPFKDTNYNIFNCKTSTDASSWNIMFEVETSWTTTGVTIKANLTGYTLSGSWQACGYIR